MNEWNEKKATEGLGHELFWHIAGMICQATNECLVKHESELSWNSKVHSRILRLAFEGCWKEREIWYKDITSAKILNRSLLPWNIYGGLCNSPSPVGTFSSDTSRCLHSRIIEKLRPEIGVASINQTASEWVRFKLIAVNIETKRGAVKDHVQLRTWITTQFARLRQLTTFDIEFPSLLVLFVQGKRWLLMIASMKAMRVEVNEESVGAVGAVEGRRFF
jgi:hypothetical protein